MILYRKVLIMKKIDEINNFISKNILPSYPKAKYVCISPLAGEQEYFVSVYLDGDEVGNKRSELSSSEESGIEKLLTKLKKEFNSLSD